MGDVIRNTDFAGQVKVFAGLKWGSISPTDIDGFLDFKDRLFVFIEAKYGDSLPPVGQRIALERLCDACESEGRVSTVLVASHKADGDIAFTDLPVVQYRFKGRWITPGECLTVQQAVNRFRQIAGLMEA